jgi:hypothetical protein
MHRRRYLAGLATGLGLTLVGCTGSQPSTEGDPNGAYRNAFRSALTEADITIRNFAVSEGVLDLEYAPAEATEASVEESVRTIARAYYDRIYGGWDVERMEAAAFVDDSLVATWRMESEWVQQHLDGDISRDELGEKIQGSVERHGE